LLQLWFFLWQIRPLDSYEMSDGSYRATDSRIVRPLNNLADAAKSKCAQSLTLS
jgi:hypothetical protein